MASDLRFGNLEIREHGSGNQIGILNNNYYQHPPPSDDAAIDQAIAELFSTNPEDDRSKQINKKGRRAQGTCSWVLDNDIFKQWMDTSNDASRVLWISGAAGMGKTMLSIFLTQELERLTRPSSNTLTLYYFCDGQETKRNTPVNILRGLIFQLIQNDHSVAKLLLAEFKIQQATLFEDNSVEALWRILRTMILQSKFSTIYGVLDGLDECNVQLLQPFLKQLRFAFEDDTEITNLKQHEDATANDKKSSMRSGDWQKFRLALVSREEPGCLLNELQVFPRLVLSKTEAEPVDLMNFTAAKVEDIVKNLGSTSGSEEVQSALQSRGDGTFLWVNIAAERIKEQRSPENMVKAIESLGPTVEELYVQTLSSLPEEWMPFISTLLSWVVVVFRPLTLEELRKGLEFTLDQDISVETITYAINMCQGILNIQNNEISITHQSFQDFLMNSPLLRQGGSRLEQFRIDQAQSHSTIARACVKYLEHTLRPTSFLSRGQRKARVLRVQSSLKAPLNQDEIQQMTRFPLLEYSVMHWGPHAKAGTSDPSLFCSPFFADESKTRQMWLDIYWMSTHTLSQKFMTPTSFSLLHVAAHFGIMSLARHVQQCGLLQSQMALRSSLLYRPLEVAIEQRQSAIVIFLLTAGALNIPQDSIAKIQYPTIHHCADAGDVDTLSWLIQRGEKIDLATEPPSLTTGLKSLVSLTLRSPRGFYYSMSETMEPGEWKLDLGYWETPLHCAAKRGRTAAADLLLRSGSNINPQTQKGWTPLHMAAYFGKCSTLMLLLTFGADHELTTTEQLSTPLHFAAQENQVDCVRELLKAGASTARQGSKGRMPLHIAAKRGHNEIVKLLLDNGANVDALSNGSVTPLIEAAFYGRLETVTVLLEWNANVWVTNQMGARASGLALEKGHSAIAQLLLDREAAMSEAPLEYTAQTQATESVSQSAEPDEIHSLETAQINIDDSNRLQGGSYLNTDALHQSPPSMPPRPSVAGPRHSISSLPSHYDNNYVPHKDKSTQETPPPLPKRPSVQSYPTPSITQSPPPIPYAQSANTQNEPLRQPNMHVPSYPPSPYGLMPTQSPPTSYPPVARPHSSQGYPSNAANFNPGPRTHNYSQSLSPVPVMQDYSHGLSPYAPGSFAPPPMQYVPEYNNTGGKQVRKSRSFIDVNSSGINVLGVKLI